MTMHRRRGARLAISAAVSAVAVAGWPVLSSAPSSAIGSAGDNDTPTVTAAWSPPSSCATNPSASETNGHYPEPAPVGTIVVPEDAIELRTELVGGSGGWAWGLNGGSGQPGGIGGRVVASFTVTADGPLKPGATVSAVQGCDGLGGTNREDYYFTGGAGWSPGGWYGGGGAGGGGSSAIYIEGHGPLAVAGGGGGGGGGTCRGKHGWIGGAGGAGEITRGSNGIGPSGLDGDKARGSDTDGNGRGGSNDGASGSGRPEGSSGSKALSGQNAVYARSGGGGGYRGGAGGTSGGGGCSSQGGGGGGSSFVRTGSMDVSFGTAGSPKVVVSFLRARPHISATITTPEVVPTSVGSEVAYRVRIWNEGPTDIDNPGIEVQRTSGTGTTKVSCDERPVDALPPGWAVNCVATYKVTRADLEAGEIKTDFVATAESISGVVTRSDVLATTVKTNLRAELSGELDVSPAGYTESGQKISITYRVTNSGGLDLTRVEPIVADFIGKGGPLQLVCVPDAIAPGESTVCRGSYTTVRADLKAPGIGARISAHARGSNGQPVASTPKVLSIAFAPTAPSINSGQPRTAVVGVNYRWDIGTAGVPLPRLAVVEGTLPPGLSLDPNGRTVSGVPTSTGDFTFRLRADNGTAPLAERNYTMAVRAPTTVTFHPDLTEPGPATVGVGYRWTVRMNGTPGGRPTIVGGALPPGLSLDELGTVSGVPTEAGAFTFTLRDDNGVPPAAERDFTIKVGESTVPPAPSPWEDPSIATVGEAYSWYPWYYSNLYVGRQIPKMQLVFGTLPPGLSLIGDKYVSGVPTVPGTFTVTLRGQSDERQRTFTIRVRPSGQGCGVNKVTVPPYATSVTIDAVGGHGGTAEGYSGASDAKGGAGGRVLATYPISANGEIAPGTTLTSVLGCNGESVPYSTSGQTLATAGGRGWSSGARATGGAGTGGGSSAVYISDRERPLLVAGGGGGGGGGTCAGQHGHVGGAGGSGGITTTSEGRGPSGGDGDASKSSGDSGNSGLGGANDKSQGAGTPDGTVDCHQYAASGSNPDPFGPVGGGGGGYVGGSGSWDYPIRNPLNWIGWLAGFGNKWGPAVCSNASGAGGGSSFVTSSATSADFSTAETPQVRFSFTTTMPRTAVTLTPTKHAVTRVGDEVEFTAEVVNTGDVALGRASSGYVDVDQFTGLGRLDAFQCTGGESLDVQEKAVCTTRYTTTSKDIDDGGFALTLHGVGVDPNDRPYAGTPVTAAVDVSATSGRGTYEAESPANSFLPGADWDCASCSGRRVGNIGVGGLPLTFNNVRSPGGDGPTVRVEIVYTNGDLRARAATIEVNGRKMATVVFPPTGGWERTGSVTVDLPLESGLNAITIANPTGWAADIDAIRVG